jgi:hypothetical protein
MLPRRRPLSAGAGRGTFYSEEPEAAPVVGLRRTDEAHRTDGAPVNFEEPARGRRLEICNRSHVPVQ